MTMSHSGEASSIGRRAFALRIVASERPERAGEEIAINFPMTVGRDESCEIVLDDSSVSRRHARIEPADEGLRVIDLGSGNGVWLGGERIEERILTPGEQFQIGSTVFGCVRGAEDAPPPVEPAAKTMLMPSPALAPPLPPPAPIPQPESVVLRVVDGGEGIPAGTELTVQKTATLGRAVECAIAFVEKDISRAHARLEITPDGLLLTDLGSMCGTWIGERKIDKTILKPGDKFRLGLRVELEWVRPADAALPPAAEEPDATRFIPGAQAAEVAAAEVARHAEAARPAEAAKAAPVAQPSPAPATPVSDPDFSGTVIIPVSPDLSAARPGRLEEAGELVELSAHRPFLLDDPASVWHVVEGGVMIFTVALDNNEVVGPRTHFLGVLPGQVMFGFDLQRYGVGSGFLAVSKQGTKVRKIPLARFQQLAAAPGQAERVAAMVDAWTLGLSKALIVNLTTKRTDEIALQPDQRVDLEKGAKATAADGVVWLDITSGSVLFDDMGTPVFTRRSSPFPLTPHSWIQPMSDEFGPLSVRPKRTAMVLADPGVWHGLEVFHAVLCECEFIGKKLSTVDEYLRLQNKALQSEAAKEAAYDAIGSVLSSEGATPSEFRALGDADAVLRACELVARAIGTEAKEHPAKQEGLSFEQQVSAIALASGFRTRVVALRDDWWRQDNGPLLGQLAETKNPVAILPTGTRSCEIVDPTSGRKTPATPAAAATLSDFAYTFYRPFPDGDLAIGQVVKFGARQISKDVRWLTYMALILGVFGTVTPYITGKIFDAAIPQADRNSLILLGAALLCSALASSAFKFVQGVATIRVQRKMAAPIQSALWDRILNLPVNFFRRFSAGDLADRAEGIADIQDLVAGAGVAAVLGSISGLFYVLQMLGYDTTLALVAIVLTLVFVAVNMTANYLQLRYQRQEFAVRGAITGLVLNLLTGVTKLRVCGAEQHAFRIWAEQFAGQRRLTFMVGSIQNLAGVFTSTYPVICSIAIFSTMVSVQSRGGATLSTGDFLAFNAAFGLFMAAMQALGDASLSLLNVVPIYERLQPILKEKPEVDRTKAFPGKLKGAIELSRVSFRYTSDGPWILRDISLKIQPGEMIAFVGSSGGGKSTLMRLMLGFEMPSTGAILYDGQDLGSIDLRMLRQQLGVVLQTSRVMPTEMYRNIIGASSKTIEDAWTAAERAGLAEDIRQMPMGMHTYVSEGGGTLSGGQRQRLMIARAIVNNPKVLFLDEATSALDNRAQAIVTESMDKMDATRIVIAHRLSTVINADRICYLHGGQLVEQGSYEELMALNGMFAALAKRQMA
jgi:NHLM bacteriocin system ABC transporter ATP-binding protein